MTISFTIPLEPTAQMRARHRAIRTKDGRNISTTYTPAKQRRESEQLMQLLELHRPDKPMSGAVEFTMVAFFHVPQSWPQWKREAALAGYIRHTKKPDIDNLQKHIKDCLSKLGFWTDDCIVSDVVTIVKRYSETPRWKITLTEYAQPKTKKEWEAMKGEWI